MPARKKSRPRPPGIDPLEQGFGKETVNYGGRPVPGALLAEEMGRIGGKAAQAEYERRKAAGVPVPHRFERGTKEASQAAQMGAFARWSKYRSERLQKEIEATETIRRQAPGGSLESLREQTVAAMREQAETSRVVARESSSLFAKAARIAKAAAEVVLGPPATSPTRASTPIVSPSEMESELEQRLRAVAPAASPPPAKSKLEEFRERAGVKPARSPLALSLEDELGGIDDLELGAQEILSGRRR